MAENRGAAARRPREPLSAAAGERGPRRGRAARGRPSSPRVRPRILVDPGRVGQPAPARGQARRRPRDAGRRAVDASARSSGWSRQGVAGRPAQPSPRLDRRASPGPSRRARRRASLPARRRSAEIQAHQALRLAPAGRFVVLVTGRRLEPGDRRAAARVRRNRSRPLRRPRARRSLVGGGRREGARRVVPGGSRARPARFPRRLPERRHGPRGRGRLSRGRRWPRAGGSSAHTPLIGCDGTEQEGKAMVARRELAATVVDAPTTPTAWRSSPGSGTRERRPATVRLDASSCPPVDDAGSRLAGQPAAVHDEHVAVDVVGGGGAQEHDAARDVPGLGPASGRDAIDDRLLRTGSACSGAVLSVRT